MKKDTTVHHGESVAQPYPPSWIDRFTEFPLDAPQLAGGRKAGVPQANSWLQKVRNCGTVRICVHLDEAVMRSTI